jgi:hypothetical protein
VPSTGFHGYRGHEMAVSAEQLFATLDDAPLAQGASG